MRMMWRAAACLMLVAMLAGLMPVGAFAAPPQDGIVGEEPQAEVAQTAAETQAEPELGTASSYLRTPPYTPLGMNRELSELFGSPVRPSPYNGGNTAAPLTIHYYADANNFYTVVADEGAKKLYRYAYSLADYSYQGVATLPFPAGMTLWGGLYDSGAELYIATGAVASSNATAITVTRVGYGFAAGESCAVKASDIAGAGVTVTPFVNGGADMVLSGGALAVYTSASLSAGGQGSYLVNINTAGMTLTGSVDKPFDDTANQMVQAGGAGALMTHSYAEDANGLYLDDAALMPFESEAGEAFTGTTTTGFAAAGSKSLVVGTSVPHRNSDLYGVTGASAGMIRNAYLLSWNGSAATQHWLTRYSPYTSGVKVSEPNLVAYGSGYLVTYTVVEDGVATAHLHVLDGAGTPGAHYMFPQVAFHASSRPLVVTTDAGKDELVWVGGLTLDHDYGKEGGKEFYLYRLDLATMTMVETARPLQGFALSESALSLAKGDTAALSVSGFAPSSAVVAEGDIVWAVSGGAGLTLSATTGKSVTLTAGATGSYTVTCTIAGISRSCEVAVEQAASGLTIPNKNPRILYIGGSNITVAATVTPSLATQKAIHWESDKPHIAKVDAGTGQVTPGSVAGTAKITATVRGATAPAMTDSVQVEVRRPATGLSLGRATQTIAIGDTFTLPAPDPIPSSGVWTEGSVGWKITSGGAFVELTNPTAGVYTVKGLAVGTATLTVSATNPLKKSVSTTFTVTVAGQQVKPEEVTLEGAPTTEQNPLELALSGAPTVLTARLKAPAGETISDTTVLWSSSAPEVARVNPDGTVVPVGAGEAVITAKSAMDDDDTLKADCHVKVLEHAVLPSAGTVVLNPEDSFTVWPLALTDNAQLKLEKAQWAPADEADLEWLALEAPEVGAKPGAKKLVATDTDIGGERTVTLTATVPVEGGGQVEATVQVLLTDKTIPQRELAITGAGETASVNLFTGGQTLRLGAVAKYVAGAVDAPAATGDGFVWEVVEASPADVLTVDSFGTVTTADRAGEAKVKVSLQGDATTATTLTVKVEEAPSVLEYKPGRKDIVVGGDAIPMEPSYTGGTMASKAALKLDYEVATGSDIAHMEGNKLYGDKAGAVGVTVRAYYLGMADPALTAILELTSTSKAERMEHNEAPIFLYVGESYTPAEGAFKIMPENASGTLQFKMSAGADIADVDAATGKVTAKAAGMGTLQAYVSGQTSIKTELAVTVSEKITGLAFTNSALSLNVNESKTLALTAKPAGAKPPADLKYEVVYETSPGVLALVGNDAATMKVEGKKKGSGVVRMTATGFSSEMLVEVGTPTTGIRLDRSLVERQSADGPITLNATLLPSNAAGNPITWQTSASTVVGVEKTTGKQCKITPVGPGYATVTASVTVGGKPYTASCLVVVNRATTSVAAKDELLRLAPNETGQLGLVLKPSNAPVTDTNVYYEVESESPAGVVSLSGNTVTAKNLGNATIRMTFLGQSGQTFTAYTRVVVSSGAVAVESLAAGEDIALAVGHSALVPYTILPEHAADQAVTITADPADVVSVSGGSVTALKTGQATLTITTRDGAKTDTLTVTVIETPAAFDGIKVLPTADSASSDPAKYGIPKGRYSTFKVAPSAAGAQLPPSASYQWRIENKAGEVLAASSAVDGTSFTVEALSEGEAKLHVDMNYGGQIYTASSTDILVGGAVTGITLNYAGGGSVEAGTNHYTIGEGKTLDLEAVLASEGGNVLDQRVIWTCSDTEGHVKLTGSGLTARVEGLKASAEGYTISARTRDGGFEASFTLYVGKPLNADGLTLSPLTVATGATRPVPVAFDPEDTANKTLKWKSLSPSVFTVDADTGEVTGVFAWDGADGPKTATGTVEATWQDDSAAPITATATITVVPALTEVKFAERDYVLGYVKNAHQELPEVKFTPDAGKDVLVLKDSEKWESSNPKVLLVTQDDNKETKLVTKAKGVSALTYSFVDGAGTPHTLTCTVRVTDAQALKASSVKLSKTSATLVADKEKALTLKFSYSPSSVSFRDVVWSTDAPLVATVDQNGVVTTLAPGKATITATARYLISSPAMAPETASCTLNVVRYAEGVTIAHASGTPLDQLAAWNGSALRMVPAEYAEPGQPEATRNISTLALVARRNPADTTDSVRWTTSNAKVVAIEGGESKPWDDAEAGNATLTAKKTGNVTITAHWGKKKASFKVSVVVPVAAGEGTAFTVNPAGPVTLALNAKKTFKPAFVQKADIVLPTNRKVAWSAERLDGPGEASEVISLNAKTGAVKALAPGSVKLTATSLDDDRAFASVTVTVVAPVTALRFNQAAFTLGSSDGERALGLTFNSGGAVSENLSEVTLTIPKGGAVAFENSGPITTNADGSTSIKVSAANPNFSIKPVSAQTEGKTTITAKTKAKDATHPYAQKSASLKVTVKKTPPALTFMRKVSVTNATPTSLAVGKSYTPKLKIQPSGVANKNLNWKIEAAVPGVSNPDVNSAKYVRFEPATGKVTALLESVGAYNGRDVVFTVTGAPVETDPGAAPEDVAPISYTFTTAKLATKVQVVANKSTTIRVGDELVLSTQMTPAEASSKLATWKLGGTAGVAELFGAGAPAAEVRLKALKAGKVTLTATAADGSKKSGKITITVQQQVEDVVITNPPAEGFMLNKGASYTFKAAVNHGYHAAPSTSPVPFVKWPAATVKTVRWEAVEYSPNYPADTTPMPAGSVVSVNAKTGKVTALADGYALVRAVAVGDESVRIDGQEGGTQIRDENGNFLTLASTYMVRVNVTPTSIKFGTPGYTQGNFTMYRSDDPEEEVTFTLHAQTIPELALLTSIYDEEVGITESRSDELTWSIPLLPNLSEEDEVFTDGRLSFDFTRQQADVALARHRKSDTEGYQTFRALSGDDTMSFKVAAVAPGETYEHKITVSADNGKSATLTVKVVGDEAAVVRVTNITLNKTATWLTVGKSETLKATLTPSVPKKKPANGYVDWQILEQWAYDENGVAQQVESGVATIDPKGKVTAKKAGYVDVVAVAMDGMQSTEVCRVYCVARS